MNPFIVNHIIKIVTATGCEPTTTQFVNEHSTIYRVPTPPLKSSKVLFFEKPPLKSSIIL